jgi:hypothetical protein
MKSRRCGSRLLIVVAVFQKDEIQTRSPLRLVRDIKFQTTNRRNREIELRDLRPANLSTH